MCLVVYVCLYCCFYVSSIYYVFKDIEIRENVHVCIKELGLIYVLFFICYFVI